MSQTIFKFENILKEAPAGRNPFFKLPSGTTEIKYAPEHLIQFYSNRSNWRQE